MSKMKYVESCQYHAFVDCKEEDRKCEKCGWCPKVEAKRREKVREELGVKV